MGRPAKYPAELRGAIRGESVGPRRQRNLACSRARPLSPGSCRPRRYRDERHVLCSPDVGTVEVLVAEQRVGANRMVRLDFLSYFTEFAIVARQ